MTLSNGVHQVAAADYHGDPADRPSLSASIAHVLCTSSPRHAWAAHPRLNPNFERKDEDKFSLGTVVHSVLLEGVDNVHVVEADDWRTKAAKEERDQARSARRIPLLAKHYTDVLEMVDAAREQIAAHSADPPLLADGKPEQTLIWDEDGVTCRARLDWLRDDRTVIEDVKTTGRSANPHEFSRTLFGLGYDLKAAFYLRGVRAVAGVDATFRWLVIEAAAPYALSVVTPGPDVLALGDDKVEYAIKTWRRCIEADDWPAYDRRVATAELPAYEETRWMERSAA